MSDIKLFENSIAKVLIYYDDFENLMPVSPSYHEIISIYLLYLLSYNKFPKFIIIVKFSKDK